jgi:probable F420-dependent oxidoreductase
MRAVWAAWQSGSKLNYRSGRYKLTLMHDFFDPGPNEHAEIPIYTAGVNPAMCRVAGLVADGLHAHPFHSARYLGDVVRPAVAEGARRASRDPSEVKISSMILVATGDSQSEVEAEIEAVRRQVAFYASTPNYSAVMELHGWGDTGRSLSRLAARRRWDDMPALITDTMVDEFATVGTWDQLPELIVDKYDRVLERATLYRTFAPDDDLEKWREFCSRVRSAVGHEGEASEG